MKAKIDATLLALSVAAGVKSQNGASRLIVEQLLDRMITDEPWLISMMLPVLQSIEGEGPLLAAGILERAGMNFSELAAPRVRLVADVLLLTVKPTELIACLRAFGILTGVKPAAQIDDQVWVAEFAGRRFAIAMVGTAGNVESALRMGELWASIDFKAAILVGMAAGVRDEVKLGDVVVAEQVLAYEFQSMTKDGPIYAPVPYKCPSKSLLSIRTLSQFRPNWGGDTKAEILRSPDYEEIPVSDLDDGIGQDWVPTVKFGNILAGAKLIEDGSLPTLRKELHERTKAAEMEGAGFAAMCEKADIAWFVVRGVADYGEPQRRKHWQFAATYAAAALVRDAIGEGLLRIPPL